MAIVVSIAPNSSLYVRDPQTSELGQRLLSNGIELLSALGLEGFTFKKLAAAAGSTEASVYRYFTSKRQLLQYLVAYYWDWVHHLINSAVAREVDAKSKLSVAIRALTQPMTPNPAVSYIDERSLHRVVLTEGTKAYHLKGVAKHNDAGIFLGYKSLTKELAQLILAVNPTFPYPKALASSLFEMAHNHIYFAEHLPGLTDLKHGAHTQEKLEHMLEYWVKQLVG